MDETDLIRSAAGLVVAGLVASAGCARRPSAAPEVVRVAVDAARAAHGEGGGGTPLRLFPTLGPLDSTYAWLGGGVPPSASAPSCAAPLAADVAPWPQARVPAAGRYLRALVVALPPSFRIDGARRIDPDAEARGGVLLATGRDTSRDPGPGGRPLGASFAVWVGPEDGYPTVGADTAARQAAAAECVAARPARGARVIEFTLSGSTGAPSYYLGAVWPLGVGGRHLRFLGSSDRAGDLPALRLILASVASEPPPPAGH